MISGGFLDSRFPNFFMPKPLSLRALIVKLKRAGCTGPFFGAKHPYMRSGQKIIIIPNPHGNDIGPHILKRIMRDIGLSEDDFRKL